LLPKLRLPEQIHALAGFSDENKKQQNLQAKQIRMHHESVDTYSWNNGIAARTRMLTT